MCAYFAIGEPSPDDTVPDPIEGVNPFLAAGEWLRCALHTHSTVSDGTLAPRHLVQAYQEQGFDVVAVTDHWRLTEVASTDRVLTIPAAELGWDIRRPHYPRQSAEFLVYGIDHVPDDPGGDRGNWYTNDEENYEVRTFPDLTSGVAWAETMGAVVYVAHPYWTQLPLDDLLEQRGFAGLEVYNGASDLATGRGDSSVWWDALLGRGRRTFGIGTDDQHYPLFDLATGWTMVRAAERTQNAVLAALRDGMAYFSHGPAIRHVEVVDGAVEVACSPARSVLLQGEEELGIAVSAGRGGMRHGQILATDDRGLITHVRFDPRAASTRYRRVTVVDAEGRRAWSNPL
jgi:hypothetical protein